ncbi:MAG: hypothetical protein HC828_19950 [Blastochloris sp.]|nr:hypothetical protein [Blastochloris sp.]
MCRRHALSFEVNDALESRFEHFCSRACYAETQRRVLPFTQEFLIAAIVIIIVLVMYVSVVSWFI